MYNQKFTPYGGFPNKNNQLYEQQYEEEESQPLVEEVDDSYEPTQKEVKEYAIETLGMRFPEDEGLLYLAREGLKAPLPDNWVPYQGRDGEVYYKHRITQEKTYDHPTDLEYRKKYEQQKEKMARKNLKSMNMKASNQLAVGPTSNILNNNASNLFASKMSNSNMLVPSNDSAPTVKLDPRIEQEYQEQLQIYEERLKKEWRELETEERQRSENRIKKSKQEYQNQISRIYSGKQKEVKLEDKIKEEKDKIKEKIEQSLQDSFKEELKDYEKQLQHKNREFSSVYDQDMHLKINKYQQEKDTEFQQKQHKLQELINRLTRQKENKKKEVEESLKRLKNEFENGQNKEIEAATADALQQELHSIKLSFSQKIKEKESQLQREYGETKRILGFDHNAYLSQLASKKGRIKAISQQKIESYKKKQMQSFILQCQNDLQQTINDIKDTLASQYSLKLAQERHRQEQKLKKQKERLDHEFKLKIQSQIQNIYDEMKIKIRLYETDMNKKLSSVQEKFISDIHGKSKGQSKDITFRIETKEKELSIQNKSMLINSLRRQIELESVTLELIRLQSDLYQCKDDHQIDERLIKLAKYYNLEYRSDKYLKFENNYKQMKDNCRKDKEFLASVMGSLQNYKGSNGIGSQALLKQYNQDVRIIRQNEQMLRKMEVLLRRAEINDKSAIEDLSKEQFEYKQIELKREMIRAGSLSGQIEELPNEKPINRTQEHFSKTKDIESALKDHSKFLSNMRSELNRKLYQIRSGTYY